MIAVIQTGGKQYIVKEGQTLEVEKLEAVVGGAVSFDQVLLISDESGTSVKTGTPVVSGAKVEAEVLEQGRADKISVIKYKPKVHYRRNYGHRQPFTKVKISKIVV